MVWPIVKRYYERHTPVTHERHDSRTRASVFDETPDCIANPVRCEQEGVL
jgi:hypothetical protein